MALLLIFAFVAGAGTAFSPCILPVLPVALSAGATGGRRRPLGVATGLAISHTFALIVLVYVIDALGLPNDLLRNLAIGVLVAFGFSLVVPALADRVEAFFSGLVRVRPSAGGDGFGSGVFLGLGLGLVYAPCAGPVLAGVLTVSASQDFTAGRLAVAISYGIGSAVAIYFLMLGGRRMMSRLSRRSVRIQQALGVVMITVAVAMAFDLDTRFQTEVASALPSFLVNPTEGIESGVSDDAAELQGRGRSSAPQGGVREAAAGADLPVLRYARGFQGTQEWFNTPGDRPLTLEGLRGRVVLVDFWTYTCINCIRTLPYLRAWDERYRDKGLTIVGVHTPEFAFERDAGNVRDAIEQNRLRYPVAQDNERAVWDAYANQFWPAKYLIDAEGRVRYTHFGEGEYETTEKAIRALLREADSERRLGGMAEARVEKAAAGVSTPETYLGALRADGWVHGPLEEGTQDFPPLRDPLPDDAFAFRGRWTIGPESATAAGDDAAVSAHVGARRVFLVMSGNGRARDVRVLLDGKPLPDRLAGPDVRGGVARVREERLYRLVSLPRVGRHVLTLEFDEGVSAFAFTFG